MLFNNQGKQVNVSKQINSKTHPHVFAPLREVLIPSEPYKVSGMFKLENRVTVKGV